MDATALSGSFLINITGAALALLTPPHGGPWDQAGLAGAVGSGGGARATGAVPILVLIRVPRLFVGADLRREDGAGAPGLGCPADRPVDRGAAPAFPLFGAGRPFAALGERGPNPEICALIGASGRVVAAYVFRSGGNDGAVLREARRLRFMPATRDGRAVAAWHRLVINRRDGAASLPLDWLVGAYEPVPPPPRPVPLIVPPVDVVFIE